MFEHYTAKSSDEVRVLMNAKNTQTPLQLGEGHFLVHGIILGENPFPTFRLQQCDPNEAEEKLIFTAPDIRWFHVTCYPEYREWCKENRLRPSALFEHDNAVYTGWALEGLNGGSPEGAAPWSVWEASEDVVFGQFRDVEWFCPLPLFPEEMPAALLKQRTYRP